MLRNVEIKARVSDPTALFERAVALAGKRPVEILQDDTFFACPLGRLKLRELDPSQGELIFYRRADACGPKESKYILTKTKEPALLRDTLTLALGVVGRVRKRRLLFLVDNTRIHLDEVEGLGHFMELEVVLRDDQSAEDGMTQARRLMAKLSIAEEHLVAGAYVDFLNS